MVMMKMSINTLPFLLRMSSFRKKSIMGRKYSRGHHHLILLCLHDGCPLVVIIKAIFFTVSTVGPSLLLHLATCGTTLFLFFNRHRLRHSARNPRLPQRLWFPLPLPLFPHH